MMPDVGKPAVGPTLIVDCGRTAPLLAAVIAVGAGAKARPEVWSAAAAKACSVATTSAGVERPVGTQAASARCGCVETLLQQLHGSRWGLDPSQLNPAADDRSGVVAASEHSDN
jgi:hypothetical protein